MLAAGGATPLMYACQQCREIEVLDIITKQPYSVKDVDRTLKTPLHYCAENSTTNCAEAILRVAPELVNAQDENGYSTLHMAVIAGNKPLIKVLITKGADINVYDNEGHSAVHWAIVSTEKEALEMIIRAGANPSTPDIHGGYPLHYAAQMCGSNCDYIRGSRDAVKVVQTLLHFGVDVNVKDKDGRQPILWAASAGSADAVVHLINGGASVEAADKDGLTALHCAASRGHSNTLETLITLCGADVDLIDGNGCSALFYSVTLGHADSTEILLKLGAEPNRQDRKGRTPAHCGAAKGQLETLKILRNRGGNLWMRNVKGDLPLHEAVASGRKDLVLWLLSQNPEAINIANNDGRVPLHIAAMYNNTEMVKILLDAKSLVNPVMRTSKGILMTPLNVALCKGHRSCGKFLQLHGGVPFSKVSRTETNLVYTVRISPSDDMLKSEIAEVIDVTPSDSKTSKADGVQITKSDVSDKKKVYRRRKKRKGLSKEKKNKDNSDSDSDSSSYEVKLKPQENRKDGSSNDKDDDVDGDDDDDEDNKKVKAKKVTVNDIPGKNQRIPKKDESVKIKTESPSAKKDVREETVMVKKATKRSVEKPLKRNKSFGEHKNISNLSPEDFPPMMQSIHRLDAEMMETEIDLNKPLSENENLDIESSAVAQNSQTVNEEANKHTAEQDNKKTEQQSGSAVLVQAAEDVATSPDVQKDNLSSNSEAVIVVSTDDKISGSENGNLKPRYEEVTVQKEEKMGKSSGTKRSAEGGKRPVDRNGKPTKVAAKSSDEGSSQKDKKFVKEKRSSNGFTSSLKEKSGDVLGRKSSGSDTSVQKEKKVKKSLGSDMPAESVSRNEEKPEKESESVDVSDHLEKPPEIKTSEEGDAQSEKMAEALNKEDAELNTKNEDEAKQNVTTSGDEVPVQEDHLSEKQIESTAGQNLEISKSSENIQESSDAVVQNDEKTECGAETKSLDIEGPQKAAESTKVLITDSKEAEQLKEDSSANVPDEVDTKNATSSQKVESPENIAGNEDSKSEVVIQNGGEFNLAEDYTGGEASILKDEVPAEVLEVRIPNIEVPAVESSTGNLQTRSSGDELLGQSDTKSENETPADHLPLAEEKEKNEKTSVKDSSSETETKTVALPAPENETEVKDGGQPNNAAEHLNPPTNSSHPQVEDGSEKEVEESTNNAEDQNNRSGDREDNNKEEKSSKDDEMPNEENLDDSAESLPHNCGKENGCNDGEGRHFKPYRVSRLCRKNRDFKGDLSQISVTQLVQSTIRKYHMERGIFHLLLELKRLQIRAGRANEQVLVKRLADEYERSRVFLGMKHFTGVYKFREFEKFLYDQLKALNHRRHLLIPDMKSYDDIDALSGILKKSRVRMLSEAPQSEALCTCITQRCHHTTHAYTNVPCSAYIANVRRHKTHKPKKECFLPRIDQLPSFKSEKQKVEEQPATLELVQGNAKQVISLPQNYPDKGKRYYVTFTIKSASPYKEEDFFEETKDFFKHRHAKSV